MRPENDKSWMLILAYLGPFAVIPWLGTQDNDILYHARQGVVLFLVECFIFLILGLTTKLWLLFFSGLGLMMGCFVWSILFVILLLGHTFLIIKALEGKKIPLPLIQSWAEKL